MMPSTNIHPSFVGWAQKQAVNKSNLENEETMGESMVLQIPFLLYCKFSPHMSSYKITFMKTTPQSNIYPNFVAWAWKQAELETIM